MRAPVPPRDRQPARSRNARRRTVDQRDASDRERTHRTTVEMPPRGRRASRAAAFWFLPWLVLVAAVGALVLMAVMPSRAVMTLAVVAAVAAVLSALHVVGIGPPES